jgi:UDP-N-acetylglucosamine 4-epimerase
VTRAVDDALSAQLGGKKRTWLVTGVAGFIGSSLLEALLGFDQNVVGLDNFLTGKASNLDDVQRRVSQPQWSRFRLITGDIRSLDDCRHACAGADIVLHQAALGSVPRSLHDPLTSHQCNVDGFVNMLLAARELGVRRFVYAASSSTYGDSTDLPKREEKIGRPLSPYAVTKYVNELYADVFARCYQLQTVGLRYFNVFGRRQDPDGAYAAVIPRWFASLLQDSPVFINGDGETSRDFCHVDNAVQANIRAGLTSLEGSHVYNVAVGERTTLNQLYELILAQVAKHQPALGSAKPVYRDFRDGDVRHSLADIGRAREELGYAPAVDVRQGLQEAAEWYISQTKLGLSA